MGVMSHARTLGYRSAMTSDGRYYIYLPSHRRRGRKGRKIMGMWTENAHPVDVAGPPPRLAAEDPELAQKFPALVEYLTEQVREDGTIRVTSTLLVSCEDGMWKLCLTDRAGPAGKWDYKVWHSGGTLAEVFGSLDRGLQDNTVQWRKYEPWGRGKKR